jgi:hypothetical protein
MARPLRYEENELVNDVFRFVGPGAPRHGLFLCLLCQNPAPVQLQYSNASRMKSCGRPGCQKAPIKPRRIDYAGQVFDCIRITKFIGKGRSLYEALCVCGNTKVVRMHDVIAGKVKTCGDDACTASLRADKEWRGDVCAAAKKWHAADGRPDYFIDTGKELAPGVKYYNPETFCHYDAEGYEVGIKGQRILVQDLPVRTRMDTTKMRNWNYQLDPASPADAPAYIKNGSRWAFMGMTNLTDDMGRTSYAPWCIYIGSAAAAQEEKAANTDRDGYALGYIIFEGSRVYRRSVAATLKASGQSTRDCLIVPDETQADNEE